MDWGGHLFEAGRYLSNKDGQHTVQRFVRYVIFESRLKGWSIGKRMS